MLRALSERLQGQKGSVAILASARATNEELYLIGCLARHFDAITDCVPREGEADALLVRADKNPNGNGARALGFCFRELGIQISKIEEGIASGHIKHLIYGRMPPRWDSMLPC